LPTRSHCIGTDMHATMWLDLERSFNQVWVYRPRWFSRYRCWHLFRKWPDSNLGRHTDNTDWGFSWFFSVHSRKCGDGAPN
jgi:hypothetical protein